MSNEIHDKREIAQREARDKTAKIVSGLIPGGSSVYELFTAIVTPLHIKRKEEWVREVTMGLHKLETEGKIHLKELSQNEEFNSVFTKATLLAQQTHQKEKVEALRNVVLNSAEKLPQDIIEFDIVNYFLSVLERMNPMHIFLLNTFQNFPESANMEGVELNNGIASHNKKTLFKMYPELYSKGELIDLYWSELYSYSLVTTEKLELMITPKGMLYPDVSDLGIQLLYMIEYE